LRNAFLALSQTHLLQTLLELRTIRPGMIPIA
jgi:hypothetical protein